MRYRRSDVLKKRQKGFTLIELLLYVAIVGSLLVAVSVFFTTTVDARIKNQSIMEVNDQGLNAIEYITETIRNSSSITSPAAGASAATLTLSVPTAGLSPTVFSLSGTTLQVKEGAGAAVTLTNGKVQISALSFKNLTKSGTKGIIQISFTISRVNTAGRNPYDYQKTFIASAALR
ncbi:MAG TPA: type II secretion system protein [Candidatus Saccharimonadales bacterium]|nr:type II secretion system protein [Candidatus Saccharimonadales bacterium]